MNIEDRVRIDGEKIYVSIDPDAILKGLWVVPAGDAPPDLVAKGIRAAIIAAVMEGREACYNIALALDSSRGNEIEIAKALGWRSVL